MRFQRLCCVSQPHLALINFKFLKIKWTPLALFSYIFSSREIIYKKKIFKKKIIHKVVKCVFTFEKAKLFWHRNFIDSLFHSMTSSAVETWHSVKQPWPKKSSLKFPTSSCPTWSNTTSNQSCPPPLHPESSVLFQNAQIFF